MQQFASRPDCYADTHPNSQTEADPGAHTEPFSRPADGYSSSGESYSNFLES